MSGGRATCGACQALVAEPDVLILDEPTNILIASSNGGRMLKISGHVRVVCHANRAFWITSPPPVVEVLMVQLPAKFPAYQHAGTARTTGELIQKAPVVRDKHTHGKIIQQSFQHSMEAEIKMMVGSSSINTSRFTQPAPGKRHTFALSADICRCACRHSRSSFGDCVSMRPAMTSRLRSSWVCKCCIFVHAMSQCGVRPEMCCET